MKRREKRNRSRIAAVCMAFFMFATAVLPAAAEGTSGAAGTAETTQAAGNAGTTATSQPAGNAGTTETAQPAGNGGTPETAQPAEGAETTDTAQPKATAEKPAEEEQAVSFADVENSYAKDAITRLADLHLINGQGGDRFYPQNPISRQDMAVLIGKVVGLQPVEANEAVFADVQEDSAYAPYVYGLAELDVLRGRDDQTLGATDPLTRQEMAVILGRLMKEIGVVPTIGFATVAYEDEAEIADYAKEAVQLVSKQKWMQGANGRFNPKGLVTRAEAAVIAQRLLDVRYEQAEMGEFAVDVAKLQVMAGDSQRLKVTRPTGDELPFTPIFAFDRPELGTVLGDGTFVAGPAPGKGNLTVTVGYRSLSIPVEITEAAEKEDVADEKNATEKTAAEEKAAENTDSEQKRTRDESESAAQDQESAQETGQDGAQEPDQDADQEQTGQDAGETAAEPAGEEELVNFGPESFTSVQTIGPADPFFREVEKQYPGPVGGLTAISEEWTGYNRQYGRKVTVALPEAKALSRVNLTFQQQKTSGITLPKWLEVEVSQDGKAWSYAGKALHDVSAADEQKITRTLAISLPEIEARYVRVTFPVEVFVFARQLEVWGKDSGQGTGNIVLLPQPNPTQSIQSESTRRPVENMLLAYTGMHGDLGTWREEDFLPMVGYMTQDGYMRDQMFDTVLFLPYQTMPATKESWTAYMDDLFRMNRQLDALNNAMREYNRLRGTLYTTPTKENVVLAIPYPAPAQTDFGKLPGSQTSLSFSQAGIGEEQAYENRKKAVEWYFQELMKRWEKAGYSYLRLEGIYWFHELVEDSAPKDRELIRSTAAMVHEKALRFYWIPYFGAPGMEEWKSLSFDYAFLQPNYYSDKSIPLDRFDGLMDAIQKYGFQIEIEGDNKMYNDPKFYQLYYNQLAATHRLGLDKNTIHAYYYGSKTFLQAFKSEDPALRAIYDDTYKWMRGRFDEVGYTEQELFPQQP